jgi:hypothetical protein
MQRCDIVRRFSKEGVFESLLVPEWNEFELGTDGPRAGSCGIATGPAAAWQTRISLGGWFDIVTPAMSDCSTARDPVEEHRPAGQLLFCIHG